MKRTVVAYMLFAIAVTATAGDLIISKDGTSVWVVSIRREGSAVYYRTQEGGSEKSLAVSKLDLIIPSVKRGRTYTPATAEKALKRIRRAISKHPKLSKQLQPLKQQWDAVKNPDMSIKPSVDALVEKFGKSDKSPKTFQKIAVQIEMLAFKDAAGVHADYIREAIDKMKKEVYAIGSAKLDAHVDAKRQTLDNFVSAKRIVDGLKMARASADQKTYLDGMLASVREATLVYSLKASEAVFFDKKSVGGYLSSMAILDDLSLSEVVEDQTRARVARHVRVIGSAANTACKNHTINEAGFPFSAGDTKLLQKMRASSSSGELGPVPIREQAFLIPTRMPGGGAVGARIKLPIRVIFRRMPAKGRRLSLVGMLFGPGFQHGSVLELPKLKLKDGHTTVTFSATIPAVKANAGEGWNGVMGLMVYLGYQGYRNRFSSEVEWIALSRPCRVPVQLKK